MERLMNNNAQNATLVVVDMQAKLAPAMSEYTHLRAQVQLLLSASHCLDIHCVVTEQYPEGLGPTDAQLKIGNANYITKTTFSAAQHKDFEQALGSHQHIYLCGMESHVCVYFTAMDLLAKGYTVSVIADAVCSRKQENKQWALLQLRQAGVQVCSAETAIFGWMHSCEHPQFKEVLALIK
ncbi:hydrolase [Pseudoalteromonas ruthenica]|nr:hydrolase [Pseudoalteromonas ruthenica]TMO92077.1 hydrolase [Pseudoalteromonas ruthenica]TMO99539.1 hydrolase [Pseudoalteromonas ruthenica]TMP06640.1 hydrolase [Pseudoalteromonas ruthenica]TMP10902.1 hydrolase [Pseudoalteromonas ruthenica]